MKKIVNGFTFSDCHCEECDSTTRQSRNMELDCHAHLRSLTMTRKAAFTLSETLMVVIVLGIVATLVIPSLLKRQVENVKRTKVKKAMASYESALSKMIITNDLRSDIELTTWAGSVADCGNTTQYFKKSEGEGCIFKTSDGVWWNIENIQRPIIYLRPTGITQSNKAEITQMANDFDNEDAYVMVGRFDDNRTLRVNDLAYEKINPADSNSYTQVLKLYGEKLSESEKCVAKGLPRCSFDGDDYDRITIDEDTTVEGLCSYDYKNNVQYALCNGTSTAKAGNYYIKRYGLPIPDEEAKSPENCATSTNPNCLTQGDRYNVQKRFCEAHGGRLPKAAESEAIYKATGRNNITLDEEASPTRYYVMGTVGSFGQSDKTVDFHLVCVHD